MTVQTTNITTGPYAGNGLSDTYDFDFTISDVDELLVYETTDEDGAIPLLLTQGTDYSVSINSDGRGSVIRLSGNLPTGYSLFIVSNIQTLQPTDFQSQGGFFPEVHENSFDRLTRIIQQDQNKIVKTIRLPDSYSGDASATIPTPRAGYGWRWNSEANAIEEVRIEEGAVVNEFSFSLNPPVTSDILDPSIVDNLNQVSLNTAQIAAANIAIAQESVDRVAAIAQESTTRASEIQAAIDAAVAADTAQQQEIVNIQQSATNANTTATAAQTQVASVAADLTALDGEVTSLSSSVTQVQTDVTDATSTANTALTNSNTALSRLDGNGAGNANNINYETLVANVEVLENAQPTGGGASIQDIQDVNARVDVVQGQVDTNAADITNVETTATSATNTANSAITVANTAQSEIDALEGVVSGISTDVTGLQSDVTTAQGTADGALVTANNAQSEINTINGSLTALTNSITTLQSDVTTAQGAANTALTNAATAQSEIDSLEGVVTGITSDVTTLQSEVITAQNTANSAVSISNTATTTANDASSTATSAANSVTTLQSDVSGLQSTVLTQATTLSNVQGDVTNQQAGYALVVNAGDSNAAIEVTANGGTGSQVNIKADRATVDRGSGPEEIATFFGQIFRSETSYDAQITTSGRMILDSGAGFYYFEASELNMVLPPGTYNIKGLFVGVTNNNHSVYLKTSTASSATVVGGLSGYQRLNSTIDNNFISVAPSTISNARLYNQSISGTGTDSSGFKVYRSFFDCFIQVTTQTTVTPYIYAADISGFGNQGLIDFSYMSAVRV